LSSPAQGSTITNLTITGNVSSPASGVGGIDCGGAAVENMVASGNIGQWHYSTCTFSYSIAPGLSATNSNITGDPLLATDYTLQVSSPCIDAGTTAAPATSIDLANNPRKVGSAVDMGAYEVQ
jgi:hypothetical protein